MSWSVCCFLNPHPQQWFCSAYHVASIFFNVLLCCSHRLQTKPWKRLICDPCLLCFSEKKTQILQYIYYVRMITRIWQVQYVSFIWQSIPKMKENDYEAFVFCLEKLQAINPCIINHTLLNQYLIAGGDSVKCANEMYPRIAAVGIRFMAWLSTGCCKFKSIQTGYSIMDGLLWAKWPSGFLYF